MIDMNKNLGYLTSGSSSSALLSQNTDSTTLPLAIHLMVEDWIASVTELKQPCLKSFFFVALYSFFM